MHGTCQLLGQTIRILGVFHLFEGSMWQQPDSAYRAAGGNMAINLPWKQTIAA